MRVIRGLVFGCRLRGLSGGGLKEGEDAGGGGVGGAMEESYDIDGLVLGERELA